jgi:hypothetical protein
MINVFFLISFYRNEVKTTHVASQIAATNVNDNKDIQIIEYLFIVIFYYSFNRYHGLEVRAHLHPLYKRS